VVAMVMVAVVVIAVVVVTGAAADSESVWCYKFISLRNWCCRFLHVAVCRETLVWTLQYEV